MAQLTQKDTPRGKVVVGDLPPNFLRITHQTSVQQQLQNDQMTAQMLQNQQFAGPGFSAPPPRNVVGRLGISMSQAKLAKNYGLTKMDPYCRIRIGHAVFETQTASNGAKNPRWNKTVQCYLPIGVDHLYLEVFDEKTFQGDERIAWAHITIPQRAIEGDTVDEWYPLSGKIGEGQEGMINLVFSMTPVEQAVPQQVVMQPPMMAGPQVVMMPAAQGMYYPPRPGYQTIPTAVQGQNPLQPGQQPAPQQPAPQPMSEDSLNQIKDMFPAVDMEVIKSIAEANRGNSDATINALLSMAS